MPRVLVQRFTVPDEAIDAQGHVNNLEYLRWMVHAAVAHSAARGWPAERYAAIGQTWVVRSHFIEYLRPAFARETLVLATWVAGFEPRQSPRRYLLLRAADGRAVARGETRWVFVDARTGRPTSVPDAVRDAFPVVTDEAEVLAAAGFPPEGRP
jgi:acyl-CoA thioester hydrolase